MTAGQNTQPINARILELVAEAERTAYAKGYADAVRNIMAAATGAAPSVAAPESEAPVVQRRERVRLTPEERADLVGSARAPWGTSNKAANLALDLGADHGIDVKAVVAAAADELGCRIAESSARSILIVMTKRGELRKRRGRWYRVAAKTEASPGSTEDTTTRSAQGDRAAGDGNDREQRWNHPDEPPQPPRVTDLRPGLPEGRAMREAS